MFLGTLFMTWACGPAPRPPVVAAPPPKPAAPPGELFRFQEKAGEAGQGKVSIRIESEPFSGNPKARKGPPKLARAFAMTEEHAVAAVDADGTQHVTGKLLDVEGKGETAKEQKAADALARALSEIKISFDRSAKGEVTRLKVEAVNDPLDEGPARIVAGSIYGAGRGAFFPEQQTEVGNGWKISTEVPIPNGGSNNLEIEYHYDKKEGTVAAVSFKGQSHGESQGAQLSGEIAGDFKFDYQAGRLVSHVLDTRSARAEATSGSILRVHVEWQAQPSAAAPAAGADQAASPAAPAAPPAK